MADEELPPSAISFYYIVTNVDELTKKAMSIDIHALKAELETISKKSKDKKVNDSAIEVILNKYYVEFKILYDEILNLLNTLQSQSHAQYIIGYKYIYDEVVNLLYDGRFHRDLSTHEINPALRLDSAPDFKCVLKLYDTLSVKIFRPLTDTLLIDRLDNFDEAFNLPQNFNDIKEYIVKALYEIEMFLEEKIQKIDYYNLPRALEKFHSLRFKDENDPKQSSILIDRYFDAVFTLCQTYEDSELIHDDDFDNPVFMQMWNELNRFKHYMQELFTPEEVEIFSRQESTVMGILNAYKDREISEESNLAFKNTTSPANAAFLLKMLEDMSITVNGKAHLSERRKGALRGIIEAAREKHILPQKGIDFLCKIVADKIGLELKSKLDFSTTSDAFRKKAEKYISAHYKV